uniref:FCH and mu domain containing endocytic adaptor 2 n=2 Tax=Callorhinchus milii TaxID=7868 RepID=A0A4W3HTX1_CALMI
MCNLKVSSSNNATSPHPSPKAAGHWSHPGRCESDGGDKNNGFDVLYHNMKHGQISTKELADFIRESVTIEDTYSRSMTKLAKTSSNYSQLGTFAPLWDVLKSSTEKLASSHLDLVRKLQELIKEVQKYGDEQTKAHKKTKEEVAGTLEAVQNIQSITQTLQKSKENYNTKCLEYERLKKEGATQKEVEKAVVKSKKATETYKLYVEKYATARTDFEQKMTETAQKFQEIEEAHLRHMKEILRCFAYSIDETHIQIGQVHEELVQNMESTTVESLIQKLAETKGTGKDRPGKTMYMFVFLDQCIHAKENNFYSSSDSGSDDEEPRKFHVEIKPMQPNNGTNHTLEELKASIGNLTLSPSQSVSKSLLVLSIYFAINVCLYLYLFIDLGTSRGPSPISLGSQDSLPVATAFTESVNAYFKGADPTKCIVKITGDMTMSFPSGIIKIFTSNPSPAVLSFRIRNTSKLEQILPNSQLVFSDLSQSDSNTKDFWMNMQTLTAYLKKLAEQNPSASYYNVDILKYQVSSNGILSTPLNLATYWKCTLSTTDVRVDYKYNPEAMVIPSVLSNVQVLMPVDGGVTCMQSLPTAVWNAEQKKALWKLSEISEKSDDAGPSKPSTLAVQFISEGSTLSGVDMELVGTGYRLSLIKKRFATGKNCC